MLSIHSLGHCFGLLSLLFFYLFLSFYVLILYYYPIIPYPIYILQYLYTTYILANNKHFIPHSSGTRRFHVARASLFCSRKPPHPFPFRDQSPSLHPTNSHSNSHYNYGIDDHLHSSDAHVLSYGRRLAGTPDRHSGAAGR